MEFYIELFYIIMYQLLFCLLKKKTISCHSCEIFLACDFQTSFSGTTGYAYVESDYMFHTRFYLFQAWITLGRAQLNFGEPDIAIESFDRALAIKVESSTHCLLL